MSKPTTVYVGLGSNLGSRDVNFRRAIDLLCENENITLSKISKKITTKPLADKNQNDYLNAVAQIQTDLTPQQLFDYLKQIESSLGRVRLREKWLSRPMDLDILFFGNQVINTDSLTIPHKQLHLRSFVLTGLCELVPDFVHPVFNETVSVLAERISGQNFHFDSKKPQLISVAGVIGAGKTTLTEALAKHFNCDVVKEAYSKNPYLSEVYAGNNALALDSQLFFLKSRVAQLSSENLIAGKTVISDYVIDKERIYASAWLKGDELIQYNETNTQLCKSIIAPVVTIYLKLSPELCLDRIHSRNRPYEQDMELSFLQTLNNDYEKLFNNWQKSPLFRVDSAESDFRQSQAVDALAEKLKAYIVSEV